VPTPLVTLIRVGVDEKSDSFAPGASARAPEASPGKIAGRYVLLEPLGRGGMGAVYAAYDTSLDRRVALKFLHSAGTGTSAEEWRARLQHEARAMARLSHPNVVTLYDVGLSEDGRSFLAMELVEGGTLSAWLKADGRTWTDVVAKLCEAGEGLAAAHEMGLIHRDFKPDNVLIGKDGRPRVTDFGIARGMDAPSGLTGAPGAPAPAPTDPASAAPVSGDTTARLTPAATESMMGTPGFMAPEQYLADETPDERADIFAFSATLYFALYGQRAFDGPTFAAIAEATVEGAVTPPPPGTDVPGWVHRAIEVGLSADRDARPRTMRAVLEALSRDPAAARRRSWWRAGAGVALAALTVSLVAQQRRHVDPCAEGADGLRAASWNQARRAGVERAFLATGKPYAADAFRAVAQSLDGYADRWERSRREACVATEVRHEVSEAVHDRTMVCLARRRDEVSALVDVLATADDRTVEKAVSAMASVAPADECAAAAALDTAWSKGHAGDARVTSVRAASARAVALLAAGRSAAARGEAESALARAREVGDGEAENDALHVLGRAYVSSGSYPQARATLLEAASSAIAARDDRRAAQSLIFLADLAGEYQGQQAPALEWFRLAESVAQRFEPRESTLAALLTYRSLLRYRSSDYDGAVGDAARALTLAEAPSNHDPVLAARVLNVLGNVDLDRARYEASLEHYQRALAIYEAQLGPSHPSVAIEIGNIALTHHARGDYGKALEFHARALALQEAAFGPDHPSVALTLSNASAALFRLGRYEEARDHASRALASFLRASGPDHPNVGMARTAVGDALLGLGRATEAVDQYALAIDDATRTSRLDSPLTASALLGRASALLALGKLDAARVDAVRATKTRRAVLGDHHPDVAEALLVEARIQREAGRTADAVPLLTEARAIVDASSAPPWLRAEVNDELARATWSATRDRDRSRTFATDARDAYALAGPGEAAPARSLDALLASLSASEVAMPFGDHRPR
jgi:tetratricopeptide (TPR) repeat protein